MEKSKVSSAKRQPFWQPLTVYNFRLLYIGESISLIGDQFYLVALPWLTILLTQSRISLGTVLMAAAIPRALLMLVGGVVSDRFSPRFIMLVSNALRVVLTILLTTLVISRTTQPGHLYIFAICFGIVDGFFIPAAKSIIPTLVTEEQLAASNILSQGTTQLIMLIGPALGGLLIATVGIETALAIDAASFIFTTVALLLIKDSRKQSAVTPIPTNNRISLIAGVGEGLNYAWHNSALRIVLLILTTLNFFFLGPLEVGATSLAYSRFPGGAVALGIMRSAWGAGGLIGALTPGTLHRHPRLGVLMLSLASIQGFGIILLGFLPNIILACVTIAVLGFCSGFLTVEGITWIQRRTSPEILGRVMSLVMLSSYGIAPFSYAVAGLLADVNITILFSAAGGIMLMMAILLATNSSVRRID